MKHHPFLLTLLPIALALVSACSHNPVNETPRLPDTVLNNTSYHIGELGTIRLSNGEFKKQYGEGATEMNQVNLEKIAIGDLNGDGLADAAVILAWQNGGSGTLKYLVAVKNAFGLAQQIDSIFIGDRPQIHSLTINDGTVALNATLHGPQDPQCCPTLQVTQHYALQANKWRQTSGQIDTSLPVKAYSEMLAPDITGILWKLDHYQDKSAEQATVIDEPNDYTLTLFANGTYQVTAGGKPIQGQYSLVGMRLVIAPATSLLTDYPTESVAAQYLERLDKVAGFELHNDNLELNLKLNEGSMVFKNSGPMTQSGPK
ncbi:MAG: META domain-containing protein [Methylococcales bacterium]|nr:META domain-containing protein [Methylococcales bacterium]